MAVIVIARPAHADLGQAFDTITATAGYKAAANFFHRVSRRLAQLEAFPFAGHAKPDYGSDIRVTVVAPYLIIHRATNETVTVLRVLHGHRHVAAEGQQ